MKRMLSLWLAALLCLDLGMALAQGPAAGSPGGAGQTGSPEALAERLGQATALDGQLAVLNDLGNAFPDELEAGLWDLALDVTPAEPLSGLGIPASLDHSTEAGGRIPARLQHGRFIVLHEWGGRFLLCGHMTARLPESMRAASLAEADNVLCLRQYPWKEYMSYEILAWKIGSGAVFSLDLAIVDLPAAGKDAYHPEETAERALWLGMCRLLYPDRLEATSNGTDLDFSITGKACYLDDASEMIGSSRLDIPASVEGYPVLGVNELGRCGVEEIVVPEGVLWLGERAFCDMPNLRSVSLPSTLQSLGYDALGSSGVLASLVLPEGLESCDPNLLKGFCNLLQLYLPSTLRCDIDLSGCENVTVYAPQGSRAFVNALQQGKAAIPCGSPGEVAFATAVFDGWGTFYALIDQEAVLLRYKDYGRQWEIPSSLGGFPVRAIGRNALEDTPDKLKKLALPEGVRTLYSDSLSVPKGCHVFLPKSLVSIGQGNLPGPVIYAPQGSAALSQAEAAGAKTVACESADAFFEPQSLAEIVELSKLSRYQTFEKRLSLLRMAAGSFADQINLRKGMVLSFPAGSAIADGLLPENMDKLKAKKQKKVPSALKGKKTLILYNESNGWISLAGDFMACLPPERIPEALAEVECVVVIWQKSVESGYTYAPSYTSYHQYYDVYTFAPGSKKYYNIYQIRNKAKTSGLKSEIDGAVVEPANMWELIGPLLK